MPIEGLDLDEVSLLLPFLLQGLTDIAIAKKLSSSDRTVRRRVADLYSHLGATNRFQAGYLLAMRIGDRTGPASDNPPPDSDRLPGAT